MQEVMDMTQPVTVTDNQPVPVTVGSDDQPGGRSRHQQVVTQNCHGAPAHFAGRLPSQKRTFVVGNNHNSAWQYMRLSLLNLLFTSVYGKHVSCRILERLRF